MDRLALAQQIEDLIDRVGLLRNAQEQSAREAAQLTAAGRMDSMAQAQLASLHEEQRLLTAQYEFFKTELRERQAEMVRLLEAAHTHEGTEEFACDAPAGPTREEHTREPLVEDHLGERVPPAAREALAEQERHKAETQEFTEQRRDALQKQALEQAEVLREQDQRREAIQREDAQRAEAIQREEAQRREAIEKDQAAREQAARSAAPRENIASDIASSLSLAAAQVADIALEIAAGVRAEIEMAALRAQHEADQDTMREEQERQRQEMERSLIERGWQEAQIQRALEQQARVFERQQQEMQERSERERQELLDRQARALRERDDRAARDGLSL